MKPSKDQEDKAVFFLGRGHRHRQMLYDILRAIGPKGASFGALQYKAGLSASTLSHHLHFMDRGGLLQRKQKGRETWISLAAECQPPQYIAQFHQRLPVIEQPPVMEQRP